MLEFVQLVSPDGKRLAEALDEQAGFRSQAEQVEIPQPLEQRDDFAKLLLKLCHDLPPLLGFPLHLHCLALKADPLADKDFLGLRFRFDQQHTRTSGSPQESGVAGKVAEENVEPTLGTENVRGVAEVRLSCLVHGRQTQAAEGLKQGPVLLCRLFKIRGHFDLLSLKIKK